ncbi:MAG: glucosaminidase domain-containing protein, partial [Erysipelotrichaceae bacterium]|nr:glucosaminidase domain-containing protein [Erysipelotrichaceae bacterium]
YLSLRSKTTLSASQMNDRITSSSSAMYNSASTFISVQNKYGINATLMFGIAINESGFGSSTFATTRNNLFGINAVDSNTSNASYFDSVEQCISEFAYYYLSCGYLDGSDYRYRGPHLGDKHSGINVKYASDPYWGEKAAAQCYYMSGASSDYGTYTIGIANVTELYLYKDESTSTKIYSSGVSGSGTAGYLYDYPVLILSGTSSWYKVQSDMALKSDRSARSVSSTYDFSRDYVYAQASQIKVVNGSVNSSSSTLSNANIISKLGYTNSSNYITGIKVGTSVSSLISSINQLQSSTTVTVKNTNSQTITSGTVSTGMTLTLKTGSSSNTYTLVIRGDVNGDGSIKSGDYVRVKNYIMGSVSLTAAQKLAADANKDGSVKSSDYVRIKNYIMDSASIEQ